MLATVKSLLEQFTGRRFVKLLLAVAILFFGVLLINGFPNYFPPRFDQGFLRGRQGYFYRTGYFVGFYAHIVASPLVLVCGVLQFSRTLRERYSRLHRRVGTAYVWLMLLGVAPGGLVLAIATFAGPVAGSGFMLLSVLVWATTFQGWRMARQHRYAEHGRWMLRSFVLFTSAIVLRLVYQALESHTSLAPVNVYRSSVWISWTLPWAALEAFWWARARVRKHDRG